MSKFLDPKNDSAFKRIFGTERNKDILIHFLNDIFARTTNPIEEVTFLKTSQNPETIGHRESSVDVMCRDEHGERFIVEMQVVREPGFEKRAQYYAAKAYIDQREKDATYRDLKAVIFLAITNFTLFPEKEEYLSHHVVLDKKTLEHDLKDFSFSFIELPKFNVPKEELRSMVQKWCYFLKNAPETRKEDLREITGRDCIIERAYDELDQYGWSAEEIRYYDSVDKKNWSNKASLEGAYDEGLAEGKAEGALEEKRKIAQQMLDKNFPMETIIQITGLSETEIKKILLSNKK